MPLWLAWTLGILGTVAAVAGLVAWCALARGADCERSAEGYRQALDRAEREERRRSM